MEISYSQLREKVQEGNIIRWCGLTPENNVMVQLLVSNTTEFYVLDINNTIQRWISNDTVRNGEALYPYTDVGFAPTKVDSFATIRNATVLGVNISGDCEPGCAKPYQQIEGCSCGYDIELNLRGRQRGGFPLPSVAILSVAIWCSCGFKFFISTLDIDIEYCYKACSQADIVSKFIEVVSEHNPLWLIGWNCYSFDNTCLLYQSAECYHHYFRKTKLGTASSVDYGYILDIPGVYNVDPFCYVQRSPVHSARFEDLSLYGVASKLQTSLKLDMPDLYTDVSPMELLEYNMTDSAIAAEVWIKSGLIIEIPSLAICSCSHIYDCIRHMTSITARCPITSEALKVNTKIDWSTCAPTGKYTGGKVFEPVRGVHHSVVVCDYSSMYPTIMIDANISPETITVLAADGSEPGSVWFDSKFVYVAHIRAIARFPISRDSIQRNILSKMVKMRTAHKKSDPAFATALKVTSNSMYGATGYEHSPMYSPLCSESVTAIGRWCLNMACQTFEENGLKVIYGDTDSCMVTSTSTTANRFHNTIDGHVKHCLNMLAKKLQATPLKNMKMLYESYHDHVLLIDKKKYCATCTDGSIKYRGVSIVRRDTLGICKRACEASIRAVLYSHDTSDANNRIASFICQTVNSVLNGTLTPSDVSRVIKRNQKRCYVYMDVDREEKSIPIDLSPNVVTDYNISYVLEALQREILRVSVPCGLGSLSEIVERSDMFV